MRIGELLRPTRLRLAGVLPKLYNFGEVEPLPLFVRLKHMFLPLSPSRGIADRSPGAAPPQASKTPLVRPVEKGLRRIFAARRFVLPPGIPAHLAAYTAALERSNSEETLEKASLADYLERLRNIAISARNASVDPDRLLWLVTSARAGEGKTFLTANLGTVLAGDLKQPVLLVDANFREAPLSKTLGYPAAAGLADVVERRVSIDEVLVTLPPRGLHLIPAGTLTQDPDGVYHSPAFLDCLETLRNRFTFTLIEAPEMLSSSAARLLAPHTDGILFVVRLYAAKRKALESTIGRLPSEKIIGVVFNYFEYWIPDWLYRWV